MNLDTVDIPETPTCYESIGVDRPIEDIFERLQADASAKLLDLRHGSVDPSNLLAKIAEAWVAPGERVPRLGILLPYDSWAMLQEVAPRMLRPILDHGVDVAVCYAQQADSIPDWFASGQLRHNVAAVVAWLTAEWKATVHWPSILRTTAYLVQEFADAKHVPGLLVDLGSLALSIGHGGASEAIRYLEVALRMIGESLTPLHCRALRQLATIAIHAEDLSSAHGYVERSIAMALTIRHWTAAARGLAMSGVLFQHIGEVPRAEIQFRRALLLLPTDEAPLLRVALHANLLEVLHQKRLRTQKAARHDALEQPFPTGQRLGEAARGAVGASGGEEP